MNETMLMMESSLIAVHCLIKIFGQWTMAFSISSMTKNVKPTVVDKTCRKFQSRDVVKPRRDFV